MKKLHDILRGYITITVTCVYPERLLNICAGNGIELWRISRPDENTICACVSIIDYRRLKKILDQGQFRMRRSGNAGLPFFLFRFKKRYVLIGAMAMVLLLVSISPLFIWEIRVTGNETVPTSEILYALDKMGIKTGTFRLNISQEEVSNTILLEIPELSYIAVNTNSSIAFVEVREKVPQPEMQDRDTPTLVYAEKTGIINKLTVLEGRNVLNEGDAVSPGDVIVTGEMESITNTYRYVHAKAEVYGITSYKITAKCDKTAVEKSYTGRRKTKTALLFADKRINLYFNSGISYDSYDKITEKERVTLFGFITLPITVVKETYAEYEPRYTEKTDRETQEEMEAYLKGILEDSMRGGSIMMWETESYGKNGDLFISARAQCTEQIGAERAMEESEIKTGENTEGVA